MERGLYSYVIYEMLFSLSPEGKWPVHLESYAYILPYQGTYICRYGLFILRRHTLHHICLPGRILNSQNFHWLSVGNFELDLSLREHINIS